MFTSFNGRIGPGRSRVTRRPARLMLHALEERSTPAQLVVTSAADNGTPGTLRSVFSIANANSEADTITFDPGISTINLLNGQLTVKESQNLSIDGGGKVTINGAAAQSASNRLFNIVSETRATFAFKDITLANGNVTGSGGAIFMTLQALELTRVTFNGNAATHSGGAISTGAPGVALVTLTECVLSDNVAIYGGALNVGGGASVTVNGSIFKDNKATSAGALYGSNLYRLNVTKSTFQDNSGGAVVAWGIGNTITDCNFVGNVSVNSGGAVLASNTTVFSRCRFINNQAKSGGAIALDGVATLTDCTLTGNSATGSGGGISITSSANLTINATTISENTAAGNGGGIYGAQGDSTVTTTNSTLAGNGAFQNGGGVYLNEHNITFRSSTIVRNTANKSGGGVFLDSQPMFLQFDSNIIAGNAAVTGADLSGSPQPIFKGGSNLIGIANPGLVWLNDNGGPTATMALAYNSPALNVGSNPAGLMFDQRGQPREQPAGMPDVGAVEGIVLSPYVSKIAPLPNVTVPGAKLYSIMVSYDSPNGIDPASIDARDIVVTGPYSVGPISVASVIVNGNEATVTYQFAAPGGTWDAFDPGLYSARLVGGEVFDKSMPAQFIAEQPLGQFVASIPDKLTVDSAADIADGNYGPGKFSLREALQIADLDLATTDTISFSPALLASQKTIVLSRELGVAGPITINGPGAGLLSISGGKSNRIFNFVGSKTAYKININSLTLENGFSSTDGGAILCNSQILTLTDCVVKDSFAAVNGGAIAMRRPTGSGIGELSVIVSRLNNNQATFGGAIFLENGPDDPLVSQSSIINNRAFASGGGIFTSGAAPRVLYSTLADNTADRGAGICLVNSTGQLQVSNSTISQNIASQFGGGIYIETSSATIVLQSSTVFGNIAANDGGGLHRIASVGNVAINSTIVASNASGNVPDLSFDVPTSISANANLIGVADVGNFMLTGSKNLTGSLTSPIDAKLGPLANNGGPTLTHALLPGSPCVNAGFNAAFSSIDQRGFSRTADKVADIGAYEAQSPRAVIRVADGSIQRSMITSFTVTFSELVSFPIGISSAFQLVRTGPGDPLGAVNLAFAQTGNVVTVTFDDPVFAPQVGNARSLIDGRYTLTLVAANIQGAFGKLDGNGNGTGGDNQILNTHRLFGDVDGNGSVNTIDYAAFRSAFGGSSFAFDFNGTGSVDTEDFTEFRQRFGSSV